MAVEVHPLPFRFPNFLKIKEWAEGQTLDCGFLSPKEAADYWDELKIQWVHHCDNRAKLISEDLKAKAKAAAFL